MVQIALDELEQMDGVLNGSHITKQHWAEGERLRQARVHSALSTIDSMELRAADAIKVLETAIASSRSRATHLGGHEEFEAGWRSEEVSNILLSENQKLEARNMAAVLWPTEHPPVQQTAAPAKPTEAQTKPSVGDPPYKSAVIGSIVTPSIAYHAHEYAEYSVKRTEAQSRAMEQEIRRVDTLTKTDGDERSSGSFMNDVLAICNP